MFQFEIDDADAEINRNNGEQQGGSVESGDEFALGDRIKFGDDVGVVKYVGPVGTSHVGTWLGVEWEDPSRGKHSGAVDGVEYFKSSVPNSASFVRPKKALKLRSLMSAFHERYGEHTTQQTTAIKPIEDRLLQNKIRFERLKVVNLSSKGVNDLSDWEQLVATCPSVQELEISDNLLSDWSSIGRLAKGWQSRLGRIDLSRNPLRIPSEDEDCCIMADDDAFLSLKHMILGGVNYDWSNVLSVARFLPQIHQLTVPYNKISDLSCPTGPMLLLLTSLDLEKNLISDWNQVLKLGGLERLEYLNLCGNQIKCVRFPDNKECNKLFPNLVRLNISENSLQDWLSVSELEKLPKLVELRMDINPVLNKYERATNRQIIITRIHKLLKLEGVEINRQERRDAELDYIKLIGSLSLANRVEMLKEHPRYEELAKKYGVLETDGKVPTANNSMQTSLINLVLVAECALKRTECEKKFLKTMTVQKLKGLLQRVFKIPSVPITITVVSCQNPGVTFVLEDEFVELGQYSVDEGDTLRIKW